MISRTPVLVFALVAGGFVMSLSNEAAAQKKKATTVEVGEITISAYVPKPVAAVDINRIAPKLSLSELRQPFLDKIEQAILKDPF
jgi:hypothetical protein